MTTNEAAHETMIFRFTQVNSAIHDYNQRHFESPQARASEQIAIINALRALDKDIDNSDTFSPNEMFEDVQTASVKYLLVPYMLGEFLLNASAGYETRMEQLKEVKIVFKKFLDRLDLLMLINSDQRKLLDGAQLGPDEIRSRKIAEFKREKALMPHFLELQQKWTKLAINDVKHELGLDKKVNHAGLNDATLDGEVSENERDVLVEILSRSTDKIIGFYRNIDEEEKILAFHKAEQEQKLLEQKNPGSRAQPRGHGARQYTMHTISEDIEPDSTSCIPSIPIPFIGATATLDDLCTNDKSQESPTPQTQPGGGRVHVATSGISSGGLRVHQLNSSEDVKAPIPQHMKEFMSKPNPAATSLKNSTAASGHIHGAGCSHHAHQIVSDSHKITAQDIMTEQQRLAKPWFNPVAGSSCECCYEDVTALPEYVMSSKAKGRQGKLVRMCHTHKVGVDICGCGEAKGSTDATQKDRIGDYVALKTDRSRVFRDRNPHLMDLDDFAKMKIASGELPGIKDRQLADKLKREEEHHALRMEAGESDEEEQKLTQREIYEREDEEQDKARKWADWVDEHEKGAGNKKYRK